MTNEEPHTDTDIDARTQAYYILKDRGLALDSGDYSMRNLLRMEHAVLTVNKIAPSLPEEARVNAIIEYFDSFHHLQSFEDKLKPTVRRLMEKQLLTEEEEVKRHKAALTERLQKVKEKEQLDMIMDTDPPSEAATVS